MDNLWLQQLPAGDRARLTRVAEVRPFARNDVLCEAGESAEAVWLPLEGVVALATVLDDGRTVDSALVGREGVVGVTCGPLNARAMSRSVARADGAAACVPAEAFAEALERSVRLREALARFTEGLFAQVQQTAACNAQHGLEARLARRLLEMQDRIEADRLELAQQDLSIMLGVRRAGVAEAAARLEAQGLVRRGRGWLAIADRRGLEALACGCYAMLRRVEGELGFAA
jgi:CRP-like cAMP-binding protein